MTIKVSIDASGGDYGIPVTIKAGIKALGVFQDLHLYFVGDESSIKAELDSQPSNIPSSRYTIIHASEVVLMNESPAIALRKKKDSSMRVAINLVKTLKANACVSAGNTGALMAISRFVLRTIKGIDRPAIMGRMPTMTGHTHMLDLGANVDSKPKALVEFATMGSIAVKHTENIASPTIGLLNIGEEDMKGSEKIKKTAELLKASSLNYVGFVEGDDIYKGTVDLIVCDGFEGNIALKASEGVALMMGHYLKQAFTRNLLTKLVALIATPVLKDFKSSLNPGKYNGASLLGLQGIIVKSHGGANVDSFLAAITEAYVEAHAKISNKISLQISKELEHNE
ncbi:MAG: Phosphate:acyl-ACP acyltransferase PlsX [Candidatus Ruthia sp. Asou_11_S2]|nr:Phosphate:acyl-ACP acyltransferase PlsX [Candidatus Ruthia sp. Asou_11_S2]